MTSKSLSGNNIASPWQPLFGRQFLHFFFRSVNYPLSVENYNFLEATFTFFNHFCVVLLVPEDLEEIEKSKMADV